MGVTQDLTGKQFNYWTVLHKSEKRGSGGGVYWYCKCKCGTEREVLGASLLAGVSKSCGCYKKEKASMIKKDYSNQKFGLLLVLYPIKKENDKKHSYWHCKCDCGNECDIRTDRLQKATSCGCKTNEKRAKTNSEDLTHQRFGKLTVLEKYYDTTKESRKIYWKCKCDCGNICYILPASLKSKSTQSCGCLKTSIGEYNIEQILKNNNIKYEKQKTFEDCIFPNTHKKGRYDFYLVQENRLIEFDGKQHFLLQSGWHSIVEQHEALIKRDKFKNKYALEHNIPLVRIPYTQRDNITLDMLLGDQYLIKGSA